MRRRRGSNALEFALTLPIMAGILAAVLEYGWYIYRQNAIFHSVRDGVRLGATFDDTLAAPEASKHTQELLKDLGVGCEEYGLPGDPCSVVATVRDDTGYQYVQMKVEIAYEPITGLLPTPDYIRANYVMMLEKQ